MGVELSFGKMGHAMTVFGKMIKLTFTDDVFTKMVNTIKEACLMTNFMDMEPMNGQMALNMKAISSIMWKMDKVLIPGQMDVSTKENGKIIWEKDMACSCMQMGRLDMKVNGRTVSMMAMELLHFVLATSIKEHLLKVACLERRWEMGPLPINQLETL